MISTDHFVVLIFVITFVIIVYYVLIKMTRKTCQSTSFNSYDSDLYDYAEVIGSHTQ